MMKYKREADAKYKADLEKEIARLRDFEVSKIKMEEAQKYREKLNKFTEEMETLHLQNVKELKSRENETVQRIKEKERQVEQAAYEHRQKVTWREPKSWTLGRTSLIKQSSEDILALRSSSPPSRSGTC